MDENRQFIGLVRRLRNDATLREDLESNAPAFCRREGLTTPAAAALLHLLPHLAVASNPPQPGAFTWWF